MLVVSVFFGSERNPNWINLQLEFLKKNTHCPFDHAVVLNEEPRLDLFTESKIIKSFEPHSEGAFITIHALPAFNAAIEYMRSQSNNYNQFLLLDSDSFPIAKNWDQLLNNVMLEKNIAAPVRVENLDLFPHPSAIFMRKIGLEEDVLFYMKRRMNLEGELIFDASIGEPVHKTFPLVRSNVYNYHPLFSAIYFGMFYHHGCGSRPGHTRMSKYFSQSQGVDKIRDQDISEKLYQQLISDPDKHIRILLGKENPCRELQT